VVVSRPTCSRLTRTATAKSWLLPRARSLEPGSCLLLERHDPQRRHRLASTSAFLPTGVATPAP
jgi:hypothetical protein